MKDKVKKVKVELIAKELVMSERHQVKLVKIEIFGARGARPVTRDIMMWSSLDWSAVSDKYMSSRVCQTVKMIMKDGGIRLSWLPSCPAGLAAGSQRADDDRYDQKNWRNVTRTSASRCRSRNVTRLSRSTLRQFF